MIIYNTITHYSSAQTWCEGAIADKWATDHGCDLEQVQDITNHHKEWDWFSCDTTSIPIWDQVTTSSVEGKGPSCKCAYGKCCGSRDAEANDRCFKNDGKTTCSIGSKLACCCESSVVEDALEDELGAQDGPFLRVKID